MVEPSAASAPQLILGPMLRHVATTSATVWVETDAPCTVSVLDASAETFTVAGHHYALVIVTGLEPGSVTEYQVHLDGEIRWPLPEATFPPSSIRTLPADRDSPLDILFGSCRTAAPHEPPWSLELALDKRGRGVDAVYAHATRMLGQPRQEWPELMVWLGDQVYADDSSPKARAKIDAKRDLASQQKYPVTGQPPELVGDFEEYTWLYLESWSMPVERWFFSVVPSVMIFDDHEMIDDWNISDSWVRDIRREPWWEAHVTGGLMTYWIYQHLGNLDPEVIAAEGILDALLAASAGGGDAETLLREWAMRSEEFTPTPGGYRFSFVRELGRAKLVMIDTRNGRVLDPEHRAIVDDGEWDWIVEHCRADVDHLIIGSSLPAFVPGGMHDLQLWSEAVCDGAWGKRMARGGEWIRRKIDMEDWSAFRRSFDALVDLLAEIGHQGREAAPATICVISGDIHFSYQAEVHFPDSAEMSSRVHQLVNSPIRNALTPPERFGMRMAMSRFAIGVGRALRRSTKLPRSRVHWRIDRGPVFANCIGRLVFDGRRADLQVEQASPEDDGSPRLDVVFAADLTGSDG